MVDMVTMGVQAGGPEADAAVAPHYMPLRKLLSSKCNARYSSEVDEFALVLRIDGSVDKWSFEGCDRLRRSRTGRYITVDIGVPEVRWNDVSRGDLRRYLMDCVRQSFQLFVAKLKKDKTDIDADKLFKCLDHVAAAYLQLD
jgi:hypothetical protein